jgi:hypothetical protein
LIAAVLVAVILVVVVGGTFVGGSLHYCERVTADSVLQRGTRSVKLLPPRAACDFAPFHGLPAEHRDWFPLSGMVAVTTALAVLGLIGAVYWRALMKADVVR